MAKWIVPTFLAFMTLQFGLAEASSCASKVKCCPPIKCPPAEKKCEPPPPPCDPCPAKKCDPCQPPLAQTCPPAGWKPSCGMPKGICSKCVEEDALNNCISFRPVLIWFTAFNASKQKPQNNGGSLLGATSGLNMGFPLVPRAGIGLQVGGSFSYYNWGGAPAYTSNGTAPYSQREYTATGGLFKKRLNDSRWSAAVVYDALWGEDFGFYCYNVRLFQYRAEINIPITCSTDISLWGSYGQKNSKLYTGNNAQSFPQMYQPLSQACIGIRQYFKRGGTLRLYGGIPYGDAPYNASAATTGGGTYVGPDHKYHSTRYIIGFNGDAPLTRSWYLYGNGVYTKGRRYPFANSSHQVGSAFDTFAVYFGLSYYFGGNPNSAPKLDQRWAPILQVADHTSMIVDVNALDNS